MILPAKKSLGQHFLLNPTTIEALLSKAQVSSGDQILEIGPGPGVMTRLLLRRGARVVAVEKDHRLVELLREELKEFPHLTLIEGDILETDLDKTLSAGKWKVVANLPYNISTQVVFHLLEKSLLFNFFYLMFQKEVALRFVASPGSRDYGLLPIFSQILSENRILLKLPPGAFTPPPQVSSALVEFRLHEAPRFPIVNLPFFEKVVQASFAHRRKMIRNCLRDGLATTPSESLDVALSVAGIAPSIRAEELSIGQFTTLANHLYSTSGIS